MSKFDRSARSEVKWGALILARALVNRRILFLAMFRWLANFHNLN